MKKITFIFIFLFNLSIYCQIDAGSLMGLPTANNLQELVDITTPNPSIGSIAYNLEDEEIYRYTGATNGWQKTASSPSVYVGSFIITGTTPFDVTTPNFRPTSVTFSAHANIEDLNTNDDNGTNSGNNNDGNNNTGINNSFGSMNGFARLEPDGTTIVQNFIYVGGHGNSINDISRFSSDEDAIGIRYGSQNGIDLGRITAKISFDPLLNGFTVTATKTTGATTENLVVLFTAYK